MKPHGRRFKRACKHMRRTLINEFKNTPWGKKYVFSGFSDCSGLVAGRLKAEEKKG